MNLLISKVPSLVSLMSHQKKEAKENQTKDAISITSIICCDLWKLTVMLEPFLWNTLQVRYVYLYGTILKRMVVVDDDEDGKIDVVCHT